MAPPVKSAHGRGEYRTPALLEFAASVTAVEDPALRRIRETTEARGLPPISIGPEEGKILDLLARLVGARKAVEIGTLAGYSACWLARALGPGGVLHTLEYDPKHASVARENLAAAGVVDRVRVHVGAALDTLPALEKEGPFDLCFIDADKVNYPNYLDWATRHVRSGGVVIGDNAYLFGRLHLGPKEAGVDAAAAEAMRRFLRTLADPALFASCALLPTGEGMAVAVRR